MGMDKIDQYQTKPDHNKTQTVQYCLVVLHIGLSSQETIRYPCKINSLFYNVFPKHENDFSPYMIDSRSEWARFVKRN